jgi:signal peptidase I
VRNYCPADRQGIDRQGIDRCRSLDVTVPERHVLVLGDNRANSWDGRFWPGGPFLPDREIIGRAFWRFYPFNAFGSLAPTTPSAR